jgi:hypothetical protein
MNDIVCLSGSIRFFPHLLELASILTKQGKIVLAPFVVKDGNTDQDTALDALHQRNIALSETLSVVTVDCSLGESTRHEIAFAREHDIPIVFWQPDQGESTAV